MPVTAKLSRRFYEQFGDELTNELVEWFNSVDATYRSGLKEVNELNFVRFEARLDQRFAEVDAKLERRFAESDAKWEHRFAEADAKWEHRFAEADAKWEQRYAELMVGLEKRFAESEARMLRWMFTLWTGTMMALAGMMLAILRSP